MSRVRFTDRVLILLLVLLGISGTAFGQIPAITSNGSLGAVDWSGTELIYLNTDAMSIDVYTFDIGYVVGGGCPAGTYSSNPVLNRCARLVSQPGGADIVVFDFTTISVASGFRVAGSRPAAVAATGDITISGGISADNGWAGSATTTGGSGTAGSGPGPGGGGGGPVYDVAGQPVTSGGGGGGGGASAGAAGNPGTKVDSSQILGGSGGVGYLTGSGPLRGGSGGGSGGLGVHSGIGCCSGPGGSGGGALILATPGSLIVSGAISADGKAGGVGDSGGGSGGGGGAGFLVIRVGGTLVLNASGAVSAAGGAGGGTASYPPGTPSLGGAGGGGVISIQAAAFLNRGTTSVAGATVGVIVGGASDDADHDGLPDTWEREMGLNPAVATGDDGPDGDPDHDGKTNLQEYLAGTHPRGFYTRYFAEGAIIPGFFEVYLALLNVDPAVDGHVWLRFQREGAAEVGQAVAVPALGRRTVRVNDNPVMGTPAYTAFSTMIESDVRVVADRTMVWDSTGYGSHAETSVEQPRPTWYLAEGATHSGFELYYLIQNPNTQAINVQVTYLRPAPLAPVVRQYAVAGTSRKTIFVNGEGPELASTDLSAVIQSLDGTAPIIVERAMYLTDGWGHKFGAGHESAGVPAPSTHWFLAEGATVSGHGSTGSFFDMYVLIANPNAGAATVTTTYLLPDGTTLVKTFAVAANSRQTVFVNQVDPKLADTSVSTVVTATLPVVVERAMWWPGPTWATWYEAHNSPGTTETGTEWALAEGEQGGGRTTETFILIANTSAFAGQAQVTLLFEDGSPAVVQTFDLLPNSRRTIYPPWDFAAAFPAGAHRRFGSLIESVGPTPAQIVVERAMYSNDDAGVVWAAGTNAVATKLK